MKTQTKNNQAGFTLIEFIVTLVIAAIAAAMIYTFMGTMMTRSSDPIFRLQNASKLHLIMENIVADFNRLNALNLRYTWQTSTPYSVGSVVVPATSTGYYYTCVTAGTSGATPPSHTTGTANDGGVTWKAGGVIWMSIGTPVENIVWHTSHIYSVGDIMIPINNNGHYYRCTTTTGTTGTSGATEPAVWKPTKIYAANTIVVPSLFNGCFYRSTAGTSGTVEPVWPTSNGDTVTGDGGVTWTEVPDGTVGATLGTLRWTEAGTILAKSATASNNDNVLNDNIWNYLLTNPARYGTDYIVVTDETKFIQFDGTTEVNAGASGTSNEKNILKVTIQGSTTGEKLTQLFTIR